MDAKLQPKYQDISCIFSFRGSVPFIYLRNCYRELWAVSRVWGTPLICDQCDTCFFSMTFGEFGGLFSGIWFPKESKSAEDFCPFDDETWGLVVASTTNAPWGVGSGQKKSQGQAFLPFFLTPPPWWDEWLAGTSNHEWVDVVPIEDGDLPMSCYHVSFQGCNLSYMKTKKKQKTKKKKNTLVVQVVAIW